MSRWLRKRVVLVEDIDLVKDDPENHMWKRAGATGVCTVDLFSENVFSVIFDDNVWVTFPARFRKKFKILEGQ